MQRFAPKLAIAALLAGALAPVNAAPQGNPRQSGQRPSFDAAVARVEVDVIVTGPQGFVEGLRAGDFRVFEDGRSVRVLGVDLVDLALIAQGDPTAGARPSALSAAASDPAASAATSEPAASAATSDPAATVAAADPARAPGVMVLLVDTPSSSRRQRSSASPTPGRASWMPPRRRACRAPPTRSITPAASSRSHR